MTKKILIVFLISVTSVLILQAADDLKDWLYYKDIKTQVESKYCHLFLDEEVYKYSNGDLSDLRIIDSKKKIVPFYIIKGSEEKNSEVSVFKTKRIFNYSEKKQMMNYFDFQVIPPDKKVIAQKLILGISSDNFSKRVGVYARNESGDWEFIRDDTVYNLDKYKKLDIGTDCLSPYGFYRVVIIENPENISVESMEVVYSNNETSFKNFQKNIRMNYSSKEKDKSTLITIDNENKLKILKIYLTISGIFKRNFSIYENENPENPVYSGELYQFDFNKTRVSSTNISFNEELSSKQILLKIFNNDDKPLPVSEIRADFITDKVVFENRNEGPYTLLFGNGKAEMPVYDISSYTEYIEKEKQGNASLSRLNVENIKLLKQNNFNYRLFFNIIIIFVSIILIGITALTLRRVSKK